VADKRPDTMSEQPLHFHAPGEPGTSETEGESLYAARKKLHVRSTSGRFTRWRWIFVWLTQLLFYGLPWLTWNDRQAVLFHLSERRFYIFDWVFWPQDVVYLTVILIISAFGLFFFTAIAGRLWCGYTCPQTVYTEIFMWIEEKIEGDHMKRRRLEQAPMSPHKFTLRSCKYGLWAAVALWTGFTFVAYFTPLDALIQSALALDFGFWELFWILFYAIFTYVFAGVLREQVCKYMCPYARFQGVMFDPDTLVVTYDEKRGEPRGARRKGVEPVAVGKGDCIDCGICVQVCPTGIDIRDGLQYECIGCGACIDACDQVMERMDYPPGLIRYDTENAVAGVTQRQGVLGHLMRPRILFYGAVLTAICVALIVALSMRADLRVDIIRDRATLSREVEGGLIENIYRLHVTNVLEREREVVVSASGLDGAHLSQPTTLRLAPASIGSVTVQVRVPHEAAEPGVHSIEFELSDVDGQGAARRSATTFIMPQ